MKTDKSFESINLITEHIIGAAFEVSNTLGCGFLEKVYENALAVELRQIGRNVPTQRVIKVKYRNVIVGDYIADLLVDEQVLVEVKHAIAIDPSHTAQCLNYLRATQLPMCLLLNFGRPKLDIKRIAGR
jgi:GxxExxY protein